jgi:hypothetical protein
VSVTSDEVSATLVEVSVKLVERCQFVKKPTQEVNNTRLGLIINSAIVEPQLDVSFQVPKQALVFKSPSVILNLDLRLLSGTE